MKYKLNTYGWSAEFIGKNLTNEQVEIIENFKNEKGCEELWEVRFDLYDADNTIDIYDGDMFHVNKALDNQTMIFELEDENGNIVLEFKIEDLKHISDVNEDWDDYISHRAYPLEEGENIYVSVDENKGGIWEFEIESDEVPTIEDFTFCTGSVDFPDGDWDYIDRIFYKGEVLEPVDYLDSTGKSSTVNIFKYEQE
jgi:hypothetical protein